MSALESRRPSETVAAAMQRIFTAGPEEFRPDEERPAVIRAILIHAVGREHREHLRREALKAEKAAQTEARAAVKKRRSSEEVLAAHEREAYRKAWEKFAGVRFALYNGESVDWLEADRAQHETRIEMQEKLAAGITEDISRHEAAVNTIAKLGLTCLADLWGTKP